MGPCFNRSLCSNDSRDDIFLCNLVKPESSHCIPNPLRLNPRIMKSGPAPLANNWRYKQTKQLISMLFVLSKISVPFNYFVELRSLTNHHELYKQGNMEL